MKNDSVSLSPISYVIVHRLDPDIYDVYEANSGSWLFSRVNPDNVFRELSDSSCIITFIDELSGQVYEANWGIIFRK